MGNPIQNFPEDCPIPVNNAPRRVSRKRRDGRLFSPAEAANIRARLMISEEPESDGNSGQIVTPAEAHIVAQVAEPESGQRVVLTETNIAQQPPLTETDTVTS